MQYTALPSDIWCWPDFADLTPEDRYYLLYLHLNPHVTVCGCYPLTRRLAAAESGYNDETSDKILTRLVEAGGWVELDVDTREILLLRWKELNPGFFATNSKTYTSLVKHLEKIKSDRLCTIVRSWMSSDAPRKGDISPMHAPSVPHASITTTKQDTTIQINNTPLEPNDVVVLKILNPMPAHERPGLVKYVRDALQVGHKASVVEDAVKSATKKAKKPEGAAGLAAKMLYGLAQMPPTVLQSIEPVSMELSEDGAARVDAEDLFNGPWTYNYKAVG